LYETGNEKQPQFAKNSVDPRGFAKLDYRPVVRNAPNFAGLRVAWSAGGGVAARYCMPIDC
jgi:hypothetical protein